MAVRTKSPNLAHSMIFEPGDETIANMYTFYCASYFLIYNTLCVYLISYASLSSRVGNINILFSPY